MKVIFWSPTIPRLAESVAREGNKGNHKFHVCLQLEPWEKTADYSGAQFDEVLRNEAHNFALLEKNLVDSKKYAGGVTVVMDVWGLIFQEPISLCLNALEKICKLADHVVFIGPRSWPGLWKTHALYNHEDLPTRRAFHILFKRAQNVFEKVWNLRANVYFIQSSPTAELLEMVTGRQNLLPLKRLSFDKYPEAVNKFPALFSKHTDLAKEILNIFNDLKAENASVSNANEYWLRNAAGKEVFDPIYFPQDVQKNNQLGQILKSVNGLFSECSWASFCEGPGFGRLHADRHVLDAVDVSRSQIASWLHYLGILEVGEESSSFRRKYAGVSKSVSSSATSLNSLAIKNASSAENSSVR